MVQQVMWFLRWVLPPIGKFIYNLGKSMLLASYTFWVGFPESVRRMAQFWLEHTVVPVPLEDFLYNAYCVLAVVMVIGMWIFTSYLTVWIVGRLF